MEKVQPREGKQFPQHHEQGRSLNQHDRAGGSAEYDVGNGEITKL